MTTQKAPRPRFIKIALVASAIGAIAGLAAVYGIGGFPGSGGGGGNCTLAEQIARDITPYRTGDIAGFIPSQESRYVADLTFTDKDGASKTLGDFAGKTVLLNLWATWCAPCRKEMPTLDRLQEKLGSDDFTVLTVNIDRRNTARAEAFFEENGIKNLAFFADPTTQIFETLKRRGRAVGMPTTMLVDGKGCEIGVLHGIAEWDSDDAIALIKAALGAS